MKYNVVFRVTREYVVTVEAEGESAADRICEEMPLETIERLGAGRVTEDIEIAALAAAR